MERYKNRVITGRCEQVEKLMGKFRIERLNVERELVRECDKFYMQEQEKEYPCGMFRSHRGGAEWRWKAPTRSIDVR